MFLVHGRDCVRAEWLKSLLARVAGLVIFEIAMLPQPITMPLIAFDSVMPITMIVILGFVFLLGVWERVLLLRARGWPVVQGIVDSAWVQEYSGKRHRWMARLDYSFLVRQKRYTGRYSRRFDDEEDARDWVRDLAGKPLLIHHSQRWPLLSFALQEDVNALLQTRLPEPPPSPAPSSGQTVAVPLIRKLLAYPLMLFALAGFVLSLYVHIAAWLGRIVLPESWMFGIHAGMFVPFLTAIFLAPKSSRRSRNLETPLDGSLGRTMLAVLVYAIANFVLFMVAAALNHGHASPLQEWRGFSGHWMLFYFWSFGFLYAAVYPGPSHSL